MQLHHEAEALQKQAREYYEQAYRLQMDGRVAEAIKLYRLSLETFETPEAHTFLGWAYSYLGDYDRAIEECTLAIEIDPEYGNPYNDIAAYLMQQNKHIESEAERTESATNILLSITVFDTERESRRTNTNFTVLLLFVAVACTQYT